MYFVFVYIVSDTAVLEHDQPASADYPDETSSALGFAERALADQPKRKHEH